MPDSTETMQRINRANNQAGGISFWPDEWRDRIDPLTEALDDAFTVELPYDQELVARRIAGHLVRQHVTAGDQRSVFDKWCPGHDESRPETMANLYVLVPMNPAYVIPLQHIEQIKQVATELRTTQCDARVTRHCQRDHATKFLAVVRGEYVCLFNTCRPCKQHIHQRHGFNEDYTGPNHDWTDGRKAESREQDDPFDV